MPTFSNQLSDAEIERLAILSEEMGEAQQVIGKIIRHGFDSYDPTGQVKGSNRFLLCKELGDVLYAIDALAAAHDVNGRLVETRQREKAEKIKPYLHHQVSPTESTKGQS